MNKTFLRNKNVLWVAGLIISLLCVGGLVILMFQERAKRITVEQDLTEATKAKQTLELKLNQAQSELGYLKDQAKALAREIEQEKSSHQQSLQELSKKDTQLKKLENSLAEEKKQTAGLSDALAKLKENYSALEEQLKSADLDGEAAKSNFNISEPPKGVELKKIVVKPRAKQLSGRVLVVNREFQFIVVDLGTKDGLNVGDELRVYQGLEELGRVRVEKAYSTMSTATILPGSQEHLIIEDNTVKSF